MKEMVKTKSLPMLPFEDLPEVTVHKKSGHEKTEERKARMLNMFMLNEFSLTGYYDMPIVVPNTKPLPNRFIAFHEIKTAKSYNVGVLFYEDDYQFDRLWNHPIETLELLRRFSCVIGVDFSQYLNMPYPARLWNNFRNKQIMAWLQARGVNVVPNVTWSDPMSLKYCCEGMPKHSIIAINSLGVLKNPRSRNMWLRGYRYVIKHLQPTLILRYGEKVPGENESISRYIDNPYIKRMRNGR